MQTRAAGAPSCRRSGATAPATLRCKPRLARPCRASSGGDDGGSLWPWSAKAAPPPPPPPPPQQQRQQQQQGALPDDLLRTSPKWRWPAAAAGESPGQSRGGTSRARAAARGGTAGGSSRRRQQQQQLSPAQQRALQDMLLDSTVNPKWRWPSFSSDPGRSSSGSSARQQGPPLPPPPPPPPPPPAAPSSSSWWRLGGPDAQQQQQQQQQRWAEYQQQRQQYEAALRQYEQQQQQQQQQERWQWPFVGGAFSGSSSGSGPLPPEEEFRDQLEALGVDLSGSRGRSARQADRQRLKAFEAMDDKEVAALMDQVRQSRLARVAGRQDEEVVGIAGLYLALTLLLLFMAALANLPG